MPVPDSSEYAPFYAGYVSLVPEADILSALERQASEIAAAAAAVPAGREAHRYEAGKWSIRELLGHVCDAERVFGFRAFCFSRGEAASLPSFDEKEYTAAGRYEDRALTALAAEFAVLRASHLAFLRDMDEEMWVRRGIASGHPVSVRALVYIMAGHPRHHLRVLRERYGVGA